MVAGGRRLWRASLWTVGAFLLAGGGFGFLVVAQQDPLEDRALIVPAPRPGDRATYAVNEVILDPDEVTSTTVPTRAVYEWLPERAEVDASFATRLVHPLRATFTFASGTLARESTYDAVTGAVVAESSTWSWSRGGYWGSSPGTDGTHVDAEGRFDDYRGPLGPCGFRVPLQGQPYDGADIVVQGRCDLSGRSEFPFADGGWSSTTTGLVREFRDALDPEMFLQFDESSPFPVRVTAALSEVFAPWALSGRTFVLERIDAVTGKDNYTATDHSLIHDAGPIPSAPRTAWGLDETGLPKPRFSLSEAYDAALALPTRPDSSGGPVGPDAADWLREHPSAYLASAMPYEGRDRTEQPVVSWFLAWTDGKSVLGKQVAYAPAGVQFLYLPNTTGYHATVYDWDTQRAWNASGSGSAPWTPPWEAAWPWQTEGLVPPEHVPSALPRPAELVKRFADMSDYAANVYGFSIECADVPCSAPMVAVVAGHSIESWDNMYTSQYDVLVHPLYSTNDILAINGEGRLDYRWRYDSFETAAFPVLPAPASNPPAHDSAGASTPWVVPLSPGVAAGISIIGLLVGVLYYFWPILKGLPTFSLFSRTDDEELLDHPTRLRIHEAVQREPGIHFMDLARESGVGRGTLDHHLRKLTAAGLVTVHKASGYACYFAKGAAHRNIVQAAPLLRSEGSRAVFEAIRAAPGISGRELARRLARSPSTVHYHVGRLEAAGLVLGEGDGIRLSPRGERASSSS